MPSVERCGGCGGIAVGGSCESCGWVPPVVLFAPIELSKADQRRLADLRAGNTTREKALAAQGVALNEQAMVALQTRALIRLFVGDDPARQLAYDIAYQEAVSEGLGEVEADLRRRKLTGGLVVPNGRVPRG